MIVKWIIRCCKKSEKEGDDEFTLVEEMTEVHKHHTHGGEFQETKELVGKGTEKLTLI